MATIRELFHEIGNWHNKISLCAGVTKAMLKGRFKSNPITSQEVEEMYEKLTKLEQYALKVNKTADKLQEIIYDLTDPDKEQSSKIVRSRERV